jgi:hypothetical protein
MKHILDAVQSALPFGPEASVLAANDALPAPKAMFVRAKGLADYRKTTGFLFRAVDKAPPKA